MEYSHEDFVADFATRTLRNLRVLEDIEKTQPGRQVYETTQLINSLLGLLVLPHEKFIDRLPSKTLNELRREKPQFPVVRPKLLKNGQEEQVEDLQTLLRLMRNAVAHFNMKFQSDVAREIKSIELWNKNKEGRENWRTKFTLEEIKVIFECLFGLLTAK